jgi:pre-rRNA-processing protein TSR2
LREKKIDARIECSTSANVTGEEADEDDEENWEDNDDDGREREDEEMEDAPQLLGQQSRRPRRSEPEVDEDGFTVVEKGSKRH